jgi:hypothetical protein
LSLAASWSSEGGIRPPELDPELEETFAGCAGASVGASWAFDGTSSVETVSGIVEDGGGEAKGNDRTTGAVPKVCNLVKHPLMRPRTDNNQYGSIPISLLLTRSTFSSTPELSTAVAAWKSFLTQVARWNISTSYRTSAPD